LGEIGTHAEATTGATTSAASSANQAMARAGFAPLTRARHTPNARMMSEPTSVSTAGETMTMALRSSR